MLIVRLNFNNKLKHSILYPLINKRDCTEGTLIEVCMYVSLYLLPVFSGYNRPQEADCNKLERVLISTNAPNASIIKKKIVVNLKIEFRLNIFVFGQ